MSTEVARQTGATIEITSDEGTLTGADVIYGDIWASMGEEALIPERAKLLTPYRVTEQTLERTGNRNVLSPRRDIPTNWPFTTARATCYRRSPDSRTPG